VNTLRLEAAVCVAAVCVLLTLGLWPFHAPRNNVQWLRGRDGLEFSKYGTVWSQRDFEPHGGSPCSIEVWFRTASGTDGGSLLAFSTAQDPVRFRIRQYGDDAIFETPTAHFAIDRVFRPGRETFLAITGEGSETVVYRDGVRLGTAPEFRHFRLSTADLGGRLVLGASPREEDIWRGRIYGLAFYAARLSPADVHRHYRAWTSGVSSLSGLGPFALYRFDEHGGRIVHDAVPPVINLEIPARFGLVRPYHMQPFWHEFRPTVGYLRDGFINIIGFIPAGFLFYSYLKQVSAGRRAMIIATLSGTCVSLTIEILQGFLPTRYSGTTDLFTNTFGTYLGIRIYGWGIARRLYCGLLGWFSQFFWTQT
jgi:hypothetical protein